VLPSQELLQRHDLDGPFWELSQHLKVRCLACHCALIRRTGRQLSSCPRPALDLAALAFAEGHLSSLAGEARGHLLAKFDTARVRCFEMSSTSLIPLQACSFLKILAAIRRSRLLLNSKSWPKLLDSHSMTTRWTQTMSSAWPLASLSRFVEQSLAKAAVSRGAQGYLKAYVWHATSQIVFQKGSPFGFPPVSSVRLVS
jgi:hypothetical protein